MSVSRYATPTKVIPGQRLGADAGAARVL